MCWSKRSTDLKLKKSTELENIVALHFKFFNVCFNWINIFEIKLKRSWRSRIDYLKKMEKSQTISSGFGHKNAFCVLAVSKNSYSCTVSFFINAQTHARPQFLRPPCRLPYCYVVLMGKFKFWTALSIAHWTSSFIASSARECDHSLQMEKSTSVWLFSNISELASCLLGEFHFYSTQALQNINWIHAGFGQNESYHTVGSADYSILSHSSNSCMIL